MFIKGLDSGVIVEVHGADEGFTLRLIHRDRTAEWILSPAEAEALMDGLMTEYMK